MTTAPFSRPDPGPLGDEPRSPAEVVELRYPGDRPRVLLVGNPNVGKSVLFRNLTDRYVVVSNFPGTTVEVVRAEAALGERAVEVVDSPGINDLGQRAEDAAVTRRLLAQHPDATVIQVADAKNLRRALLLTLQLTEAGHRMVLVLNMMDELAERGGRIDVAALESALGIPVVPLVATRGEGRSALAAVLDRAVPPTVEDVGPDVDRYERTRARMSRVREIMARVYSIEPPPNPAWRVRLGFWAMHPIKGLALLGLVLGAVFWFVGLLGAGTLVDLLEVGLFQQRVQPIAIAAADAVFPFPHIHEIESAEAVIAVPVTPVHEVELATLSREVPSTAWVATSDDLGFWESVRRLGHDFLVGPYGAVTMAVSYALAIVLPIVTTFFLVFSLLEDSGYLPRLSIMLNRLFKLIGLNGKAVLPMILGLGCDTMATMTTRILETKKERIVTTMLLALAVPCSAQLGVLLAMMASLSLAAALGWAALLLGVILFVGWLTARVFPGEVSDFMLEIPPLRRPQLGNVWLKTRARISWYLREVIPLFVLGTAVLFLFEELDLLTGFAKLTEPVVQGWLGLPAETANAFLVGFMRRDFGAVYLLDAASGPAPLLSPHQIFVAMITITLFMPCFANFLMIAKEHGQRMAWAIAGFVFPFAIVVGGVVHHVGTWVGW